jgi:hypothetical protein
MAGGRFGRGGRGGGGRGGRRPGGNGQGGRGGRGGFRRRGGFGGRGRREGAEGGNRRERISVESGNLVLIDQFMLANPQFMQGLSTILDEGADKKDAMIRDFGGEVVQVAPGTYRIDRDPFQSSIVIHPEKRGEQPTEGDEMDERDAQPEAPVVSADSANDKNVGKVYVDTRCIAMIDRELLDDSSLLEKYHQLWFSGRDKACRDLIRDNGGAVRYGFQRYGDELDIKMNQEGDTLRLTPTAA